MANDIIQKLLNQAESNPTLFGDSKWKDAIINGYKAIGNDYGTLKTYHNNIFQMHINNIMKH